MKWREKRMDKMAKKIIVVINVVISFCLIIVLGIYTVKVKPECERVHVDDIDRTREIKYLDDEMAREIANVVMGIDNVSVGEEDTGYEVEVIFDEQNYEWVVSYISKEVMETSGTYETKSVRIRKDNGIITLDDR